MRVNHILLTIKCRGVAPGQVNYLAFSEDHVAS